MTKDKIKEHSGKFNFGLIISWALFVIFGLAAIGGFMTSFLVGFIPLLVALIWLPPASQIYKNKTGKNLGIWTKIGVTLIGMGMIGIFAPDTSEVSSDSLSKSKDQNILSQQSAKEKASTKLASSYSNKDILKKCECRGYCYGAIYDTDCLIESAVHPDDCIGFVGVMVARSLADGSPIYFTDYTKETCFLKLISKQNDTKLCDYFPEEFNYKCFATVGKKNLEPENCKNLPYSYKSDCYLYITKLKKDVNQDICTELNHDDSITCYANIATTNFNPKICHQLDADIDKINCYSQIDEKFDPIFENKHYVPIYYVWFNNISFNKNLINESYCIYENNTRGNLIVRNFSCYKSLAMYHKNLDECYNLPQDFQGVPLVRECLFYTALWNDFEIEDCKKFGVDFKECKRGVILQKRNPELCKEFDSALIEQESCINMMATDYYGAYGSKDLKLCALISNFQTECIDLASNGHPEQYQNEWECKILAESDGRFRIDGYKCYYNLAIRTLDASKCQLISNELAELKADCEERLQNT